LAYYNRGNAYAGLGNYKQAIEDYDSGIKIKPGDAKALLQQGAFYLKQGIYISGLSRRAKSM